MTILFLKFLNKLPLSRHELKEFIKYYVTHTDRSTLQQSLFHVHIRRSSIPLFNGLFFLGAFLLIIMWPTDYIFFDNPDVIRSYFWWRSIHLLIISIVLSGIYTLEFIRKKIFPIAYFVALFIIGTTGYLFGRLPSVNLQTPWFYMIFFLPFVSVVFSVRIYRRFLYTFPFPIVWAFAFIRDNSGPTGWNYQFMGLIITLVISLSLMSVLIGHMIYHLNRSNYFQSRESKIAKAKIKELADHDQLTGLYNRRKFEQLLADEFTRSERYGLDLSIMMLDLDHFKEINDTYGHPTGDDVLAEIGKIIDEELRQSDYSCRYGGEEFCISLVETSVKDSEPIAERIRESLSQETFNSGEKQFSVTCSIGLTGLKPHDSDYSTLLERADEALYDAKNEGRNCVICRQDN